MKTAHAEVTFLSELQFIFQCVTNTVVGDTIIVLLMLATLLL